MIELDYDDRNLWGLVSALTMQERTKIFKGVMRRGANDVKRRAYQILIGKLGTVRDRAAMRKTIWTKVYTRTAGFRVAVAGNGHPYPSLPRTKASRALIKEARKDKVNGKAKVQKAARYVPLARWLETGTKPRATKKGYARGSLPAINFLGQAIKELEPRISDQLEDHFLEYMQKEAKKYGCI